MEEELNNNAELTPGALSSFLSDPNALSGVADALKRIGIIEDGEEESPKKEELTQTSEKGSEKADFPLASLLSDPETAKRIPQLISLISSVTSSQKRDDKRSRLLLALRPYLSERRGNAIEYLLKMSAIGDALKILK